nr:uncharacterized protein CTRU02_04035 [Colletotrichum truncatum]KAF6796075.1 hypothetical protein CTRU02_04035 [Colletotrichum truncatum]
MGCLVRPFLYLIHPQWVANVSFASPVCFDTNRLPMQAGQIPTHPWPNRRLFSKTGLWRKKSYLLRSAPE